MNIFLVRFWFRPAALPCVREPHLPRSPPLGNKRRPYLETNRDRHPLLDPLHLPANARASPPHLAHWAMSAASPRLARQRRPPLSPRPPGVASPRLARPREPRPPAPSAALASPAERRLASPRPPAPSATLAPPRDRPWLGQGLALVHQQGLGSDEVWSWRRCPVAGELQPWSPQARWMPRRSAGKRGVAYAVGEEGVLMAVAQRPAALADVPGVRSGSTPTWVPLVCRSELARWWRQPRTWSNMHNDGALGTGGAQHQGAMAISHKANSAKARRLHWGVRSWRRRGNDVDSAVSFLITTDVRGSKFGQNFESDMKFPSNWWTYIPLFWETERECNCHAMIFWKIWILVLRLLMYAY